MGRVYKKAKRKNDQPSAETLQENEDSKAISNVKDEEEEEEAQSSSEEEIEDDDVSDEDEESDPNHNMEKLNFDFEAFPPCESDLPGLVNLLTQIFLRVDIDCEAAAKGVIALSPFGCIYKPAEEYEDDDEGPEGPVYGALSILNLNGKEKYQCQITDFLLQKAKKYATKEVVKSFESVLVPSTGTDNDNSRKSDENVGLVINEKMLHFPSQISGPAFQSLIQDLKEAPKSESYKYLLMVVKVRASESSNDPSTSTSGITNGKKKKKMGKAEKKRLAAARMTEGDIMYDNAEEELLFQAGSTPLATFQYPVHCDVEKSSKFHSTIRDGVAYLSHRRCDTQNEIYCAMISLRSCDLLVLFCLALVLLNVANADDSEWDEYFKQRKSLKHAINRVQDHSFSDDSDNTKLTFVAQNNGANCYDSKLSGIINADDMGGLSKYILDQINRARYSGSWLVHAEMIGSQRQGLEWQSVTNGDLFQSTSRHGCYYHDTQTYLIVVRY
ncbi:protein BCCIP like protein [Ditylenchus destructor]|uniref:Protein BCCIP like protein n=1 Tax=Ditylenchus destructor TaxID=166010 RepID=A0AAD4NAD1_9BILA|nr:protein BCCIP like protein [Ditylenchus destructor]